MTRDEIIAMAVEAGMVREDRAHNLRLTGNTPMERFAALVAAKEREACAQEAESHVDQEWPGDDMSIQAEEIASCIRARGVQP